MQYRRLGRTDIEVSRLVVGGGFVGGFVFLQPRNVARAMLERAFEAGINWIDTAARYGDGKSEQALGELLPDISASPYVSTKIRLDPRRLDDVQGQIEAGLAGSLQRLRRDSVDLLQLHNHIGDSTTAAVTSHDVLRPGGIADAFERLREQGGFRHAGLTAIGDRAALCEVIGSGRFETAQVYYNMLNPSAARTTMPAAWRGHDFTGVLAACRAADVGVLNIRVFGAGILAAPSNRHGRESVLTESADLASEERRALAVRSVLPHGPDTMAQHALRFSLAQADIDCIVIGLHEPEHLEAALAAVSRGPASPGTLQALEGVYTSGFAIA